MSVTKDEVSDLIQANNIQLMASFKELLMDTAGFVHNQEKSVWEPVQVITRLGVVLNTIDGSVQATDECIAKLTSDLIAIIVFPTVSL